MTIRILFGWSAPVIKSTNFFRIHGGFPLGKSVRRHCHIVVSDIHYSTGDTMRIFFSVAIAFLYIILAAGISGAHGTDEACHENRQVARAVEAMTGADCCCLHVPEMMCNHSGSRIRATADCCPSEECGGSPLTREAALSATAQPFEFSKIVQNTAFSQPARRLLPGASCTGLPPPRPPAAPRYIQHCSFLI